MSFSGIDIKNLKKQEKWKLTPKVCVGRCYKWNEEGVPLECEGRIGFGDEKDPWSKCLVFDCSFLCTFRQRAEILLTGNEFLLDRAITCDDFVIPRNEKNASYSVETFPKAALANNATLLMSSREDVHLSDALSQDTNMFDNMAAEILDSDMNDFWPKIAYTTQLLVDKCLESMKSNGSEVFVSI